MSKRTVADLGSFMASKVDAKPTPLVHEPPRPAAANNDEPKPQPPVAAVAKRAEGAPAKPAVKEEMVLFNARVPVSFRQELKLYAATIGKDMQQIVMEGVELHRQKYGKAK